MKYFAKVFIELFCGFFMIREIYVGAQQSLYGRLQICLDGFKEIPYFPLKLFIGGSKVFPTDAELESIRLRGVRVDEPFSYRIYVTNGVSEITERYAGVELPESSLDYPVNFRANLSLIIKHVTGPIGSKQFPDDPEASADTSIIFSSPV